MNIHYEDIVANGIIEMNKLNGSRKISNKVATSYVNEVMNDLEKKGLYTMLILNKQEKAYFEERYSKLFIPYQDGEDSGYMLAGSMNVGLLEEVFRGNMNNDVLGSFSNPEVVERGIIKQICPKYPSLYRECHKNPRVLLSTNGRTYPVQKKKDFRRHWL